MPVDWREAEVSTETVFREMNEWAHEDNRGRPDAIESYLCECGDASCSQPILLSRSEYDEVRAYAARFAIALDHENPEIEYLVRETPAFAVIEKVGNPARVARVADPRRAGGSG